MMKKLASLAVVAAVALFAIPAAAIPTALQVDGPSEIFTWSNLGTIDIPADGYQITVGPGGAFIQVVDCCIVGEEYRLIFDFGGSLGFVPTSAINPADDGVNTNAFDFDTAWADARLSKTQVQLTTAGTWIISIETTRTAPGIISGNGFIRAVSSVSTVPEPGTLALFGLGLAGLGFVRRRKSA